MKSVKGNTWFIKRLQDVTPAVPINTMSSACKLNSPAIK